MTILAITAMVFAAISFAICALNLYTDWPLPPNEASIFFYKIAIIFSIAAMVLSAIVLIVK